MKAEGSKCVKFESDLRLEIKQFIGYQEICQFSMLVKVFISMMKIVMPNLLTTRFLVRRRVGIRIEENLMGP